MYSEVSRNTKSGINCDKSHARSISVLSMNRYCATKSDDSAVIAAKC